MFALLVPDLLKQVWNKLLTTCNKLDGIIRPVTSGSNKSDTVMIQQDVTKLTTLGCSILLYHDCNSLVGTTL